MDIEETRIEFEMEYCESMAIIAKLLLNGKVRVVTLYGTNVSLEGGK